MAQLVARIMLLFCFWHVAGESAFAEALNFYGASQTLAKPHAPSVDSEVVANSADKSEDCNPGDCDNEDCRNHQCHFGHCSVLLRETHIQEVFKQVTIPFLMVDWGPESWSESSVIRPPIT